MRSTPSPYEILRKVKFELIPAFLRAMHTPSKAWIRSRSPSTTLRLTRTVSPGLKSGTGRLASSLLTSSWSSVCIRFIVPPPTLRLPRPAVPGEVAVPQIRAPQPRRRFRLRLAPLADLLVMPRQQHLPHRPPLPQLPPGVVGIFQQSPREARPPQRRRIADHPRQQPHPAADQPDRRRAASRPHHTP